MDPAIVVAIIALVGAIFSASISLYGQVRSAKVQATREAERVLAKYREPLVLGAYDLQSRLYNILRKDFLRKYYVGDRAGRRDYVRDHTIYLIGQYFGWTEIMRREVQFLLFEEAAETRQVAQLQYAIRNAFASDEEGLGDLFMIWRGEQSAIGERMIAVEEGQRFCIGYATFVEKMASQEFGRWFERLASDLDGIVGAPNERLRRLQHGLVDLVELLDENGVRFQGKLEKA
jgi:hypothetical protein